MAVLLAAAIYALPNDEDHLPMCEEGKVLTLRLLLTVPLALLTVIVFLVAASSALLVGFDWPDRLLIFLTVFFSSGVSFGLDLFYVFRVVLIPILLLHIIGALPVCTSAWT